MKARIIGIALALAAVVAVAGCSKGPGTPAGAGEAPKTTGETPKGTGEAPKTTGETPKSTGEAPKTTGEAPKSGGYDYEPGYGAAKPDYGAPAQPTQPAAPANPPTTPGQPPTTPAQPPPPATPPAGGVVFEQMVTLTEFKFEPSAITVPLGATVKLTVMNHGQKTHDLSIIGDLVAETDILQPGQSELLTFVASKAGTYRIVCTQKGHAAEGMVAELIVK